jgi:ATP-dependent Lon protease
MATAIVSLATGRTVSEEVGMTGEITLSGQVLQIGGVREKVLAAQRAGLKRVILPRENEADLSELPEETRNELEFLLVDNVREVLDAALDGGLSARPQPAAERQAAAAGSGRF